MLDEFRSTNVTWDKATSRIYSPVTANESDENGRKLVVQVVNGGQVEDLTGASLHLYWETIDKVHDGLDVFKAVDLKKGKFELSYTTGMLSNKGVLNANLVLVYTTGRVVSEPFKITVTKGIDNDAIQSENSFSSLTQALIDVGPRLNVLTAQLQQTEQSLSSQLTQTQQLKVGDGVLASLSDIDQTFRETLTGGSVAVVGVGTVNNTTINTKQVTPDKLSHTVTINKTDLPIYLSDKFINNNGEILNAPGWNIRYYELNDDLISIRANYGSNEVQVPPYILYNNDNLVKISQTLNGGRCNTHNGKFLLNEQVGTVSNALSVVVEFPNTGYINEDVYNPIGRKSLVGNGYVSGTTVTDAPGCSYYRIDVKKGRRYKATLTASVGLYGTLFNSEGVILSTLQKDSQGYLITDGGSYFYINIFAVDTLLVEMEYNVTQQTPAYPTAVNKPFDFNGKTGILFADSLGQGVTVPGNVTPNTFIKLFSDKVGMVTTNKSIGGSTATPNLSVTGDVLTEIKKVNLETYEFVFVAIGTNDYGLGATMAAFRSAIKAICDYLEENFNGEVIFISPVNRTSQPTTYSHSLDDFRNAIAEVVLPFGHSYFNGADVPLPSKVGTYQEAVMTDGTHLLENGYRIYANALATVLT